MTNITIPLPDDIVSFLDTMVATHQSETRAGLVRRVLSEWRDDSILNAVSEARLEYTQGKYFEGDIRTLVKKVRKGKI